VRNAELSSDCPGVVEVLERAAAAVRRTCAVAGIKKAQRDTDDLVALFHQQGGCDRGIDAS